MPFKCRVFVGSSAERLGLTDAIQAHLERDASVRLWKHAFTPSVPTIVELIRNLAEADFGVFVLAPDDLTHFRNTTVYKARDNVVYELGMFVGKLGMERCFLLVPRNADPVSLPTDLAGVTVLQYDGAESNLQTATNTACSAIRTVIGNLGFASRASDEFVARIGAYNSGALINDNATRHSYRAAVFAAMRSEARATPFNKDLLASGRTDGDIAAFAAAVAEFPDVKDVALFKKLPHPISSSSTQICVLDAADALANLLKTNGSDVPSFIQTISFLLSYAHEGSGTEVKDRLTALAAKYSGA